ncbi:MAG: ATP-dependent helicase [Lachnospiraceae bacterium]|nr:ATP-dependent helicase [Lachnospiraceae bacterium]
MEEIIAVTDDNRDNNADIIIQSCFDLKKPKSFFLFAGAGSGKTKSLVSALDYINKTLGQELILSGRNVAVITFTNAACDEIKRRAYYNPLFEISTIHRFAWNLICSHTYDIRVWLKNETSAKIVEAETKLANSRNKSTKTYKDTEKKLVKMKRRLECLDSVRRFTYNPDGLNIESNSLDHSEVLKIAAEFLSQKETLQKILVDKYPILLIDESQDTQKDLINVFMDIQEKYANRFSVGLFGDIMQRIYPDGKQNLQESIPSTWETPSKTMNHRSRKRIVDLCNVIRKDVDGIEQIPREDKPGGFVRIFVTSYDDPNRKEHDILMHMSKITGDSNWENIKNVKALTLEHKMASIRLGFKNFYESLNSISSYKQGLMNGSLSAIGVLTHILLPLHKSDLNNNQFEKARIVKKNAIIYKNKDLNLTNELLQELQESVNALTSCWIDKDPTCYELLRIVYEKNIFPISKDIKQIFDSPPEEGDENFQKTSNLLAALNSPFSEVEHYWEYVNGQASFDTHQGVKGLQFERVMVIIDDNAAHTSFFSYNKLFGFEPKSETDIKNEKEGKETTLDRTRRLLYVTCSRAIDSLSIVFYTNCIESTASAISETGWFDEGEIIIIP